MEPNQCLCHVCDAAPVVELHDGVDYCQACYDSHVFRCCECSGRHLNSDRWMDNAFRKYCDSCYHRVFTACGSCGCELSVDGGEIRNEGSANYCESCYEINFFYCSRCDRTANYSEARDTPNGSTYCYRCWNDYCTNCNECNHVVWVRDCRDGFCRECGVGALWDHAGFFTEKPTFELVGSERRYGIELETHACPNHAGLRDITCFGVKEDGSVDGLEFVSPVLYGDAGFIEVDKLCEFSFDNNWVVTSSCGFHLHCDMSGEDNDTLAKVAYAYSVTYEFWTKFISKSRKRNYYCAPCDWDGADLLACDSFMQFLDCYGGERYRWFNPASYRNLQTFEIRHHAGTMNAKKIKNWTRANLRFIDAVKAMTIEQISNAFAGLDVFAQFETIKDIWGDHDLIDYYLGRAIHFKKPIVVPEFSDI